MVLVGAGGHVAMYSRQRIVMLGRLPMGRSILTGQYDRALLLSKIEVDEATAAVASILTATGLLLLLFARALTPCVSLLGCNPSFNLRKLSS